MTTLTAIVPATDRPATLASCIDAIRAADDGPEELVVVERASGSGPAAARNEGARCAAGDILVFVDADVLPHRDAFRRLRAAFERDPGLVAVFGSYDDSPAAPGAVSGFRNLLHHFVHQRSGGPAETFWAGLGAVRRDVFAAAGGFDAERFRAASVEDIELGMRLVWTGGLIRLDPDVQGTHLKAWTLAEMLETDLLHRGIPWVALLLRSGRLPTTLNLGWRYRASALASLVLVGAALRRRPAQAAGAALALLSLNASFYALLLRRRGLREAALGVGLHVVHHTTAAASVPLGILTYARDR